MQEGGGGGGGCVVFFLNDTAATEIYALSLHVALPILLAAAAAFELPGARPGAVEAVGAD